MCFFSIIVPVFNAETYLDTCISSVLSQSFSDFELLLVNDGSTDRSGPLCQQLAATDSRIHVLHQSNMGAATARNTGMKVASGTYLLFLDADDWWQSVHVLKQIFNRVSLTAPDVLCFDFQKYYAADDRISPPYFNQESFPANLSDAQRICSMTEMELWISSPCNKAIKRELLTENSLFFRNGITTEDIDWCMRLAIAAKRFDYINACVFFYRQHSTSSSHTNTFAKAECLLRNIQFCVELEDSTPTESAKKSFLLRYISYQLGTLLYVIAALPSAGDRLQLTRQAKPHLNLLSYSSNPKIKLLRNANRLVGLRGTMFLLRAMQTVRR